MRDTYNQPPHASMNTTSKDREERRARTARRREFLKGDMKMPLTSAAFDKLEMLLDKLRKSAVLSISVNAAEDGQDVADVRHVDEFIEREFQYVSLIARAKMLQSESE